MRAPSGPRRNRAPWPPVLRLAVPLALLAAALSLIHATQLLEAYSRSPFPISRPLPYDPRWVLPPVDGVAGGPGSVPEPLPVQFTVRRGETLSELLEGLGLSAREAGTAVEALRPWVEPRRLLAGDAYAASFGGERELASFEMRVAGRGRIRLARLDGSWEPSFEPEQRTVRARVVSGRLETALEVAIEEAGAPAMLAYSMADVLQWDLDFNRDLRVGDSFEVVFEEVWVDGAYGSLGGIVALSYDNRGRRFEAYRYGEEGGYYDAEGRPLKKMFLRSPLRFSRITSGFSHRRFHPILKTHRPHYGVDYGAPVGTPIQATANGTVAFAGWNGGGGKMVKLRHPGGVLTAYLHLSRFAEGIRPGRPVRQGEVIGYVGATGLATAPHLDYRVQRDGRWIDPQSLSGVPARALAAAELPAFRAWRDAQRLSLAAGAPLPAPERPALLAAGSEPQPREAAAEAAARR